MVSRPRRPKISVDDVAAAEKLAGVRYRPSERAQVARSFGVQLDRTLAQRQVDLGNAVSPACAFDPLLPGTPVPERARFRRSSRRAGKLPSDEADIAFAPVTVLGQWLARGQISSVELTRLYLDRLKRFDGQLQAVITLMEDSAITQARRADRELAKGVKRSPLHGIPLGAKDLVDTRGVPTTWGAPPYVDRRPKHNAAVVRLLHEAGAVLIAKLSLGALTYGDVWHGGRTLNPWNLDEGSSGSSAGSSAAVAAGCVGFAIGSETFGSIISAADRCGTVGLRPTFGRVPRTSAMALCWSLDKLGPMARGAEDTALILKAINSHDADDPGSTAVPFSFDGHASVEGAVIGYDPQWLEPPVGTDGDRAALQALRRAGCKIKKIKLPALPYDSLETIVFAESAAAFEDLTLSGQDRHLPEQTDISWPNEFRKARFISAVDLIQADRLRRLTMEAMAEICDRVDALLSPPEGTPLSTITNCTGHPAIAVPSGFAPRLNDSYAPAASASDATRDLPHCSVLWGRLYDDGRLIQLAMALERNLGLGVLRPPLFS